MTTLRTLIACVAGFTTVFSFAANAGESFAFPAAVLKISHPSWQRSVEIEISKAPDFRGSITKEIGRPSETVPLRSEPFSWQFVGKSNYGDVYVFAFLKADGSKEIVSALFDGVTPVIIERERLKVEISIPAK